MNWRNKLGWNMNAMPSIEEIKNKLIKLYADGLMSEPSWQAEGLRYEEALEIATDTINNMHLDELLKEYEEYKNELLWNEKAIEIAGVIEYFEDVIYDLKTWEEDYEENAEGDNADSILLDMSKEVFIRLLQKSISVRGSFYKDFYAENKNEIDSIIENLAHKHVKNASPRMGWREDLLNDILYFDGLDIDYWLNYAKSPYSTNQARLEEWTIHPDEVFKRAISDWRRNCDPDYRDETEEVIQRNEMKIKAFIKQFIEQRREINASIVQAFMFQEMI